MNKSFKSQLLDLIIADAKSYGITEEDISEVSSIGRFKNSLLTNADYQVSHAQIISRESNLMTAKNMVSMYKHASAANVDITNAIPSQTELYFTILVDDVKSHGILKNGNEYSLIIKNNNTIKIGDYNYTFKNDVLVRYIDDSVEDLEHGGIGIVNVQYIPKENQNLSSLPFIVSQRANINGIEQIGFKAIVYQQEESIHEFTFSDAQFDLFNVDTADDIVSFEAEYAATPDSKIIKLNTELFFNRTSVNTIYYKFNNSKSVTFMHKTITGGFKPITGGTLRIKTLTSKGDEANFQYDYEPRMIMRNAESFMLDIRSVKSISEGGMSSSTNVEGLRNQIIKANASRNAIAIENDLDSVLLALGDGNIMFKSVKYRNDIYRIFNVFTNINFQQGDRTYTIPTDTGTVKMPKSNLHKVERNGAIFYTLIPETHTVGFTHTVNEEDIDYTLDSDSSEYDLQYRCPYILSFDMQKEYMRAYIPYVNSKNLAEPTWVTDEPGVHKRFVLNSFDVYRSMKAEDGMRFEFKLRTDNTEKENMHKYNYDREIIDRNMAKVIFKFKTKDSNISAYTVASMISYDESIDVYTYGFTLNSDFIPFDRTVRLRGVTSNIEDIINDRVLNEEIDILLDNSIEIIGYRREDENSQFVETNKWVATLELMEDITKIAPMQYATIYGEEAFKVPLVPLVSKYFFDIERGKKHLYRSISNIKATILQVIPMLETNYDVSIKFANTCGHSKFITVGTTKTALRSLSLKPKFYIRLRDKTYNINRLKWLIAKYINEHDYLLNDYHATSMIDSILDIEKSSIDILQFIGFDGYTDREQLLAHTHADIKNDDIIEATSVKLVYEEILDEFNYDIEFTNI